MDLLRTIRQYRALLQEMSRLHSHRISQVRRALVFIQPYRKLVGIIILVLPVVASLGALEPLIYKLVFDRLAGETALFNLMLAIGAVMITANVREFLNGCSDWLDWKVRMALNYHLRDATTARGNALREEYHGDTVNGIMTRLNHGIDGFVACVSEIAFGILPAAFYLVTSMVVMIRLDWRLCLVVAAFAPLPALLGFVRADPVRKSPLPDRWGGMVSRFNEMLPGKGEGSGTHYCFSQKLLVLVAKGASSGCGLLLLSRGETTLGTLVAFLWYQAGVFGPVASLAGACQTLRTATTSIDTVLSILHREAPLSGAAEPVR